MAHTAEIFTSIFVVLGDFNPAIFSPDWLERNKLIGEGDAISAREVVEGKQYLISHQVAIFETDWFAIQVLENQLTLTSKGVLSPAFKDLAVGIFQLMPHIPVKAVGINYIGHFKLDTLEHYHMIGDVYAPKDIWSTLFADEYAGLDKLSIKFQKGTREKVEDTLNEKLITVQQYAGFKFGITLSLNDHHTIPPQTGDLTQAEKLAVTIEENWENMWGESVRVFDQILTSAID